jgi:hypothetical protein
LFKKIGSSDLELCLFDISGRNVRSYPGLTIHLIVPAFELEICLCDEIKLSEDSF